MALQLTSTAFRDGAPIPARYTCDGEDLSPPLAWRDPPAGTRSFALIADDPDAPAGTWVHWVITDIPATATGLPEGIPPDRTLADGSRQGTNSWRRIGYGGPCPPSGTHRYFFRLYALDAALNLAPGAARGDVERAMKGHILAEAVLMGTYQRRR
ncbi:MAG: YbhB/YbcL family Raf kinase inhibitor-like protein [Acidobacteria bacterium]|nr:YbhB/YbcL family Raf kinase inhibitor-like protein [Acidobacteriota bacterium]